MFVFGANVLCMWYRALRSSLSSDGLPHLDFILVTSSYLQQTIDRLGPDSYRMLY